MRIEDGLDLKTKISNSKVDIIKWMNATGIGIVDILMAFIKFVQ